MNYLHNSKSIKIAGGGVAGLSAAISLKKLVIILLFLKSVLL